MPEQGDLNDPKSSATLVNFRGIRNQNNQPTQKVNKEYYQLKINKKNSVSEPIQLNSNLQNMPQIKQLTEAHSDRSLSKKK